MPTSIYDFELTSIEGQPLKLSDYEGQVIVVVNTASKCGFAPQLADLEQLYQENKGQGLVVIGTPSNQFHQELRSDQETSEYCAMRYGVTFPLSTQVSI